MAHQDNIPAGSMHFKFFLLAEVGTEAAWVYIAEAKPVSLWVMQ